MSDELRLCPFCGMEPTVEYTEYWKAYDVHCDCELGPCTEMHTREDAIAVWNRRAHEPMTSVVRWTRYDGTPETLPDTVMSAVILARPGEGGFAPKPAAFVWRYCPRAVPQWALVGHAIDAQAGDLWAYLPHPPEGAE